MQIQGILSRTVGAEFLGVPLFAVVPRRGTPTRSE